MQFLFIFLFLLNITKILLLTPIWNLKTTADDLFLNNDAPTLILSEGGYKSVYEDNTIILQKQLTRNNDQIIEKNYYKIDNFNKQETLWEDIESFYQIGAYYICPKGSFYLTQYINGVLYERKPFDLSGKWELLCYRQFEGVHFMFTFYLNSKLTKVYYYNWETFFECEMNHIFLDVMWTTDRINTNEYPMIAITLNNNKILLRKFIVYLSQNSLLYNIIDSVEISDNLSFSEAYFFNKAIFWITYNETHFISGFSENTLDKGVNDDIKNLKFIKNTKSPFDFLDNITIKSIKFIRNTKYIYYDIITNSNNKNYIGVIDIQFNKIIYNVENVFKQIKLYSNRGLLLQTDSTVYRVCFSGKDKNGDCYLVCPSGQILILDNINSNYCADINSDEYYILKPDNIPMANCNESLYIIQNGNECGLCKDLDKNNQYKLINEKTCLDKKPENTYYVYKELKILNYCHDSCKSCEGGTVDECTSCYIGYKLVNGKCIKMDCYPSCKECDEESIDENNQHCLSCQDNKLFQEDKNNCLDNCLDGYYKDYNYCRKCYESCLTCEKSGSKDFPNCKSCKDNKYLINDAFECKEDCEINYYKNKTEKICYRCNENCETCSSRSIEDNNYCLTCDQNSEFKYLLNIANKSNCVKECPNTTILNETINQCIEIKSNDNDKDNENENNNLLIIILLIIFLIIIIIIIHFICKFPKNKAKEEFISKINNELKESNLLY